MKAITELGEERRNETLHDILTDFPYWFGPELEKYKNHEELLPFDCHMLKALAAPRTLLIGEAASDIWTNPIGSWQTTMAVKEVYLFLDAQDNLFWSFRPGFHSHDVFDVGMLVNIILHQRQGEPLSDRFFKLPFKPMEPAFDWKAPTP